MKLTHKVYNHCCFALMRRTRITINYPLIAARSHYMINYMVTLVSEIHFSFAEKMQNEESPQYFLRFTEKV